MTDRYIPPEWFAHPQPIESSKIAHRLYQGSVPPRGDVLRNAGFHALVLCAFEIQPDAEHFPGIEVIHAPNDDDGGRPISRDEWTLAKRAAQRVTELHHRGARILITCAQGRNRSGLVMALVLRERFGWTGAQAAAHVRLRRKNALTNPVFFNSLLALDSRAELGRRLGVMHTDGLRRTS